MGKSRVQLGKKGESIIRFALKKEHYTIVECNWRCAAGEVDLIAKRDGEWYFVEVRTRRGSQSMSPEQGLSYSKRKRMEKVARIYLGQHVEEPEVAWHVSFAAVIIDKTGTPDRITLYPDVDSEPFELL